MIKGNQSIGTDNEKEYEVFKRQLDSKVLARLERLIWQFS